MNFQSDHPINQTLPYQNQSSKYASSCSMLFLSASKKNQKPKAIKLRLIYCRYKSAIYFHHDESCLFQIFIYYLLKHTKTNFSSELKKPPKHQRSPSRWFVSHDLGGSKKKHRYEDENPRGPLASRNGEGYMVSPPLDASPSHAMGRYFVSFTFIKAPC